MWCMGFSLQWLLLLGGTGPSVQGLSSCGRGLVAPRHVESSWTGDQTLVPCIGRQILIHDATGEMLIFFFKFVLIRESCRQEEASQEGAWAGGELVLVALPLLICMTRQASYKLWASVAPWVKWVGGLGGPHRVFQFSHLRIQLIFSFERVGPNSHLTLFERFWKSLESFFQILEWY